MKTHKYFDFSKKVVLVTGTTMGIGKTIAEGFARCGAEVIAHGIDKKKAIAFAKKIKGKAITADFNVEQDIEDMANTLLKTVKKIDVLINNVGIAIEKPYEEYTLQEYDEMMQINIRSVFHLTQKLFPLLKKSKNASVINISSIHQTLPHPSKLPYCMSKAAMEMFSKVVSVEWAPYNIRVNCLAPGAIMTDANRDIINELGKGYFSSFIGCGKIGSAEDILNGCLYLGSEISSYSTGETFYLDGALSKGLLPYGITPAMQNMRDNLIYGDRKKLNAKKKSNVVK